jgi:heme a synthase
MSKRFMNSPTRYAWLHRFAWLTAALTLLLPVTTGAIVTTLKAGMVFADWPSSNGYSMLTYPWLSAARDEFAEHGHRLSGMTIGLFSLSLAITAWCLDRRTSVRIVGTCIFLAVAAQGMLGGARVLLDEQLLALLHGDFAALVFSLMAVLVLITSKGWEARPRLTSAEEGQTALNTAVLLLGVLIAQYVMGGFLRHLRDRGEFAWAWMVHPWFALVVLFATAMFLFTVWGSESPHIRRCAMALIALTIVQSTVGLGTWYVKYGVPSWGVVAQQDSPAQIVVCSLHKVVGLLTLMTSVLTVFCCWSVRPVSDKEHQAVKAGPSMAGAAT